MFLLILERLQHHFFCGHKTQDSFYSCESRLFGHIFLYRKPIFGIRKYVEGKLPKNVGNIFNRCHHEIERGLNNIGLYGYF